MEATTLVGSIHKFTLGYGYGGRVPTERNIPGTPSQPVRRYPVGATPRQVTSSVLLQSRPNAAERNLQNIQLLASGEYGAFHHKINKTPPMAPESGRRQALCTDICSSPIVSCRSQPQPSARCSVRDSGRSTARPQVDTGSNNGQTQVPYAMMTERTKMKAMLDDLDSSFSRKNKYDLSTAIAGPPRDIAHLKLYGVMNYKNFEEGGRWAQSLRKSGTNSAEK